MVFAALFLFVVFAPGLTFSYLLGVREYRILVSITLSYLFFISIIVAASYFSLDIDGVTLVYFSAYLFVLVAALLYRRKVRFHFTELFESLFSPRVAMGTVLAVVVLLSIYHGFYGIYDEVPADLYQHLNYATNVYHKLMSQPLENQGESLITLGQGSKVWYVLIAWIALVSNTTINECYPIVMLITGGLFSLGVICIADRFFSAYSFSPMEHQIAIAAALFFVITQMGINVFSYYRYYSFAPAMLNFVVFFSALVCLLNLFEDKPNKLANLSLICIAIAVAASVHIQESIFIMTSAAMLLAAWGGLNFWKRRGSGLSQLKWPLMAIAVPVILFLAVYIWFRFHYPIRPYYHYKVVSLPFSLPKIGQLFILNPKYQFFNVVTTWGLLVYLLLVIHFKKLATQPYLLLAMVSPLITVFNPLTTEIFLRLGQSTTLWRFCFMIPLHFVAGAALIFIYRIIRDRSIAIKCYGFTSILLLFLLLLPSFISFPVNANSRITLGKVEQHNRWHYWGDIISALNQLDIKDLGVSRRLLTDPVTGYVVEALTEFRTYQIKFLPSARYYRNTFVFDSYENFPLSKYSGLLILVNTRNGDQSESGALSGHWHKNVLFVSEYYPDNLLQHLHQNPQHFTLIWQGDKARLYRINNSR